LPGGPPPKQKEEIKKPEPEPIQKEKVAQPEQISAPVGIGRGKNRKKAKG